MSLPVPVPRPCPVCAGSAQELIHKHRLAAIEGVSLHAGYQVVACAGCGMVYADGIPSQEAFDHYYQASSRYEDPTRMGLPGPVDQARFRAIAGELARLLTDRDAAIAEMGCATGGLLAELRRQGFRNLLGVDPSAACGGAARRHHGLAVAAGTVFDPLPGGPHDVLIAVGVVEHIRDLDRAVANLAETLKPGGLLYLEVPDLEGFHLTNEAPFQEFSTEHINFFTRASLDFRPAFGHVVERIHSGGSTMQVLAWAYRKGFQPAAPEPDRAGPEAARHYRTLCARQTVREHALMDQLTREARPIAVWGAGTVACRLMATSALADVPLAAFLDSNPHLQGRRLGGITIQPPQWLLEGFPGQILIASKGYAGEIQKILREDLQLANPVLVL